MSFDWREYLRLASQLGGRTVSRTSREARQRSAISRAYYAAFCAARNHLRDREGHTIPNAAQAHRHVATAYQSSQDPARRALAWRLVQLRNQRNRADYDDTVQRLHIMVALSLQWASDIIAILTTL